MAYDGSIKIDTKIDTAGFSTGVDKMKTLATKGVAALTTTFAAVSGAIVAGGTAATHVGSDFESAMSKVSAISGATGKDLTALTDKAKEMGASTKFSASESAAALQYMAMAGWKTEDMLSGIGGIMSLAAADGLDLATTSDIVTDALTAFGMKASDSSHFADVLAKASSSANTNVSMLGESFKYVAPIAGAMGYSAEDVSVALGLMANALIKGSMAGTSLKTALSNLASPTKAMKGIMDKYGVSIADAEGKALPLADVLKQLREKFGGLSEAEQTAAASTLFGKEAMSGMLAIINASDKDFETLTTSINNADGAAQSMADTMQDNLQGQITILKSALEGLGIEIYEGMASPLKDAAVEAQNYINRLTNAFKSGGLNGMVSEVGSVISDIVTKVAEYIPKFVELATQLIKSILKGVSEHAKELSEFVVDLITTLVDSIVELLPLFVQTVIDIVIAVAQALAKQLPKLIPTIVKGILKLVQAIVNNLPTFLNAVLEIIKAISKGITDSLPIIIESLPSIIHGIVNFVVGAIPQILNAIIEITKAVLEYLPEIITSIVDVLVDNIPVIIDGIITIINSIVEALPDLITAIVDALPDIIAAIVEAVVKLLPVLIEGLIKLILGIVDALPKIIDSLIKALPSIITAIITGLMKAIPQLVTGLIQLVMELVLHIPEIILSLIGAIPTIIDTVVNTLLDFDNLSKLIKGFIQMNVEIVKETPRIIASLIQKIPEIVEKIVSKFKELIGKFVELGGNLIKGVWEGICKFGDWLREKISGFFSGIWDGIKSFFGIHSPSRKFRDEIGKNLILGLSEGISSEAATAKNAMQSVAETVLNTAKDISDIKSNVKVTTNYEADDLYKTADTISGTFTKRMKSGLSMDGMIAKMREGVAAGKELLANTLTSRLLHDVNLEVDDSNRKVYMKGDIYTTVEIDGREFAVATAPYVSEELAWNGGV